MIVIKQQGNFNNTEAFLKRAGNVNIMRILNKHAREGVAALKAATPIDSGETRNAWGYEIQKKGNSFTICWTNSNIVNGVPIAIILEYGHGTKNGGYVQGRDYIKPAIRPIFDKIANEAWKEVTG